MNIRLAAAPVLDSIVDGPGLRMTIFTQGCCHRCEGCHNPETWNRDGGIEVSVQSIIDCIDNNTEQTGITFSGGDPLLWVKQLLPVAKHAKSLGKSVWCYTGFLWENLMQLEENDYLWSFLDCIDVLVDGPFQINNKSFDCKWRGSTNQRLIDVRQSLLQGKVINYE